MKRTIVLFSLVILLICGCQKSNNMRVHNDDNIVGNGGETMNTEIDYKKAMVTFENSIFKEAAEVRETNLAMSPVSLYVCLAMISNGTSGTTLSQFENYLKLSGDELNTYCQELCGSLKCNNETCSVDVNNSIWIDNEFSVNKKFKDTLKMYYAADVFAKKMSDSNTLRAINQWVSEKTNGLIPAIISDKVDNGIKLLVANTVYMKNEWLCPFERNDTFDENFYPTNAPPLKTDFMHLTGEMNYYNKNNAVGIRLPYAEDNYSFVAVMPTDDDFESFLNKNEICALLREVNLSIDVPEVNLAFPKFQIESDIDLKHILQLQGLEEVFSIKKANFKALTEYGNVRLGDFIQKTKIIVDEDGTEAASVTATDVLGLVLKKTEPIKIAFNKPFLYAVINNESDVLLFAGIVDDPSIK